MGFSTSRPPGPDPEARRWAAGIHLFGACDHVPGLGHVATEFVHKGPLVLFPVGSMFVLDDGSGLVPMPGISAKSALIAYVRVYGLLVLPVCAFLSFQRMIGMDRVPTALDLVLQPWAYVALLCVLAVLGTVPLAGRASAARRRALIEYLGREPRAPGAR